MTNELPTADALLSEMLRLSRKLDAGIAELVAQSRAYAEAEHDYRLARSVAYLQAPADASTVAARSAWVDRACEAEHMRSLMTDGARTAALEAVRSRRAQMSALQTVANAVKAEAELAKFRGEP